MLKWVENNAVLLAVLVLGIIAWKKLGYMFGLGGPTSEEKSANYSIHAAHLVRPAKLRDGAPLAEQKAHAAKMQIYSAAVVADRLATNLDNSKFIWAWERTGLVEKDCNLIVEHKVPLALVESEYKLARTGHVLLDDLKYTLNETFFRNFLSKVTRS